jgi:septal ring factor EnvC (AmiA/AmiB activator)
VTEDEVTQLRKKLADAERRLKDRDDENRELSDLLGVAAKQNEELRAQLKAVHARMDGST